VEQQNNNIENAQTTEQQLQPVQQQAIPSVRFVPSDLGFDLPVFSQPFQSTEPVETPWRTDEEFAAWLERPVWRKSAFALDSSYENTLLSEKPLSVLLSLAYIRSIYNHVHTSGLSYLASFTGAHRTGKSVTASLFAHLVDPTFWVNFEQRVVQSPFQFMTAMKNIIEDDIIGAAVVVDEAGATFHSGDWYEKWMKLTQKFLQTCGMLKPIIFFVAPNREFIVAGMRKLMIAEHHLRKFSKDYTYMSCYRVKYNFMKKGDPYIFKRPVIRIGGRDITLKHICVYSPPDWFIERYRNLTEPDKLQRMEKWSKEVQKIIGKEEETGDIDYTTIIEDIWEKKELFIKTDLRGRVKVDQLQIEMQYNLKPKIAKYIKEKIELRLKELLEEKKEYVEYIENKRMKEKAKAREDRLRKLRLLPADDLFKMPEELEKIEEPSNKEKERKKGEMIDEIGDYYEETFES
jgi:hypothetical protein